MSDDHPKDSGAKYHIEILGYCPICERSARFVSNNIWLRGALTCLTCENGSVPRERALAHVLNRVAPDWRKLRIHESSPATRGISAKLRRECAGYTGSHFFPDSPMGEQVGGYRNENLEAQTFEDGIFDIVVTLDVFEHVFQPGAMIKEIHRTLKPGGIYLCTFPIRAGQVESHKPRARLRPDGSVEHLEKPEYHGNPINEEGALVTWDYGYTIHQMLSYWADFDVEILRFSKQSIGVLGEYTDVVLCTKRWSESVLKHA
ncbi:class I SAM-dependent methyltransferase [Luteimonas aquatica]|uniref:class I SAM-dependent methyltransferase n=1 Tax=Luteimonas aquatica TaxID=450364 RepID=UPI001F5734E5|nr:class I SAM-dependent methyltransferase [Luteimonas aquatica]